MATPLPSQHQLAILSGLPIALVGIFVVVLSLLYMAWPPDFKNVPYGYSVSHWDRMTGADAPEGETVERPTGYAVRRGLDALAYYMVFQSLVAIAVLAWVGDRTMYMLLIVSGGYGIIYTASTGLLIGPILAAVGYGMVLWLGILGWSASTSIEPMNGSFEHIEVS